ncbi:phosphocarrier protein HPr [Bacillus salitolerans]|uniref:Phosphocarrier protein HPr n=1 Tax=Bacillus salitolerans TaxID=1437434 RepID=A0ABW4LSS9_9BACI
MIEKEFTIISESGIHARPATVLVSAVSSFECEVYLEYNGRNVNLKSIMGVMSLGVPNGARIIVSANGTDEDAAISAIQDVLQKEGLGE